MNPRLALSLKVNDTFLLTPSLLSPHPLPRTGLRVSTHPLPPLVSSEHAADRAGYVIPCDASKFIIICLSLSEVVHYSCCGLITGPTPIRCHNSQRILQATGSCCKQRVTGFLACRLLRTVHCNNTTQRSFAAVLAAIALEDFSRRYDDDQLLKTSE